MDLFHPGGNQAAECRQKDEDEEVDPKGAFPKQDVKADCSQ
jgi:hypothetical protein